VLSRKQNTPKVNGSNDRHGTAEIEGRRTGDWFNAEEGKSRRRGPQSRRSKEKEVSSRQLAQKNSSEERFFTAQAGVPQQRDGRKNPPASFRITVLGCSASPARRRGVYTGSQRGRGKKIMRCAI